MTEQRSESVPEWTLGWRIQRALDHAGLTVEQIADDLGVSRSTVSRWIHDKGPVRKIYLSQIALRCAVPAEWLRTGVAGPEAGDVTTQRNGTDREPAAA
jgi:transcriptional regulator with XRE-family HTH domain